MNDFRPGFSVSSLTSWAASTPYYTDAERSIAMTMTRFSFRCNSSANGKIGFLTQAKAERPATITRPKDKPAYTIDRKTLDQILLSIGNRTPEQGGALGMDKESGCITRFFYDDNGDRSCAAYSPDAKAVTEVINEWEQDGAVFCGMIHSHPGSFGTPSWGDQQYAVQIIEAMPETLKGRFFMPIVTVDLKKNRCSIHPFTVEKRDKEKAVLLDSDLSVDDELISGWLQIPEAEHEQAGESDHADEASVEMEAGQKEAEAHLPCAAAEGQLEEKPRVHDAASAEAEGDSVTEQAALSGSTEGLSTEALFQRNIHLLPLEELAQRTVVIVGCGGARGFCESLARSAVGRFILVDGDTVSETNVATQGTYVDEIGLYKAEVIARSLRRINPHVQITEVRRFLDDALSDDELAGIIGQELLEQHPEHVLLCGCTDNFPAQDRTVRLSLKWGVPYLASQTYAEGRGGEVLFTYPGVTSTCPRCMLGSRYAAYEQGYKDNVTSEAAPIYSTERLNALKSHVAMMLLLYGTDSRLGQELDLVKDRNLILVSFATDCEEKLGIKAFSRTLAALDDDARATLPMEETVWLKQKPDRPENGFPHCPYCAGVGDLRILRGLNADTRKPFSLTPLIDALKPMQAE